MKYSFFLLFLICISSVLKAQGPYYQEYVDTLNKRIPKELAPVVLKALSHYPELDTVQIDFVINDGMHNSFMQAKPRGGTLLQKRKKRRYKIELMSSMMIEDSIIPVHMLPESALMGWFGHEIAHILDYEGMDSFEIVILGIRYVFSKKYVIRTEKRVDMIAIDHNLAEENIAWKEFVLNQPSLPKAYLDKIRNIYMPPSKIENLMKEQDKN